MHDVVILNGRLVDGSGSAARVADIAITDGVISAVGRDHRDSVGQGHQTIDADGLLVTPGFVDIHTHYDAQASWDPWLTPSSWHGCTTVVMGNCGVGFAPTAPDRHEWLIELMEGVEDIPGSAMTEGITWGWETFPEYLDALDRQRFVMDVGTQVAHGPLRAYVMGDRGAANETASLQDLSLMSGLVAEGLRAGALGFSTSRTPLHKSKGGELVPGTTCDVSELMAIGEAIRSVGHGVFQGAFWHPDVPTELGWMEQLATRTQQPVCFNLNQVNSHPDVWREVARALSSFHERGVPVFAQVAGRSIGVLMSIDGSSHPFASTVAFQRLGGSDGAGFDRLSQLERRQALRAMRDEILEDPAFRISRQAATRWFFATDGIVDYEPDPTIDSVAAIAQARGVTVEALVFDHLCADDLNNFVYFPIFNYTAGDLSMLETLHHHPATRMGLGDAGAHCGSICDGGTPTFMLSHWTRDRSRGARLPLELVIHRQTQQTAELYGLRDRGVISPGMRADVNLIDYGALQAGPAQMVFDLPGGARRLAQRATGYKAVFCGGTQTVTNDEPTGELPGRLIRGPQTPGRVPANR